MTSPAEAAAVSDNPEDTAQELVGKTLGGGYRLDALIGQGAMGTVYSATTVTGAQVAVKTLTPQVMGDHSARFLRESELARGLKHPHVVRTLDSGADEATGLLFLVMPLLKGRDLDRVLEELGALEPETAVRITLQAARGLSAAHRIGIIHRDVKPGNFILDEEDGGIIVRVCDFGIAKQIGGGSELTKTGSQLGTPDYVSPEQLKSSKHVDERTDIWSLGASLYQMLCGAAPFAHIDSVFDLIGAIVTEDVRHLQDRAPWIDPSLCIVVHKALQKNPDQRWATIEEMAFALRRFSGGDERLEPSRIVAVSSSRRSVVSPRADLRDASRQTSRASPVVSLTNELGSTDSSARRVPPAGKKSAPQPTVQEIVAAPSLSRNAKGRAARDGSSGAGKGALVGVAVLSAAIAGGSVYFFARGRAPAAPTVSSGAAPAVSARVQIVPADARVSTAAGAVPVAGGIATLRGNPGETVSVTVQHGPASKTFSVSLGSDGIATPGRLVLAP